MKRALFGMAAAAALFTATSANAAVVTEDFTEGNGGLTVGQTLYANFNVGGTDGGVTGSNFDFRSGTSITGANPAVGDQNDRYLNVMANGIANFFFNTPLQQLGLDYGSADAYNTFIITFLDGTTQSFTGQQIIDIGAANGDQSSPFTNGRLTFTATTSPIRSLQLRSSQNSLEVDNFGVINAVPEPGTWAMMLIGFGAVGFAMRRRRPATQLLPQAA